MASENHKQLIEAALFISPNALTLEELQKITTLPQEEIAKTLEEMEAHFDDHGIRVQKNDNDTYELRIKNEFVKNVKHLTPHSDFSRAEIQTLSLIAYDHPIKQSDVIDIRGNRGYDHISILVKKGFIRKEPFGHTSLLHVTQKFLEYFGLESPAEVKKYFADQGVVVQRPKKPDVEKAIEKHLEKQETEEGQQTLPLEDNNEETAEGKQIFSLKSM